MNPATKQLDNTRELNSLLSHPVLILPGLQESKAANSRTPEALRLPRNEILENDLITNTNNIRNFLLQRHLMYLYNPDLLDMINLSFHSLAIDCGSVRNWNEGAMIDPLPLDKKIQHVILKTSNKISISFVSEPPN